MVIGTPVFRLFGDSAGWPASDFLSEMDAVLFYLCMYVCVCEPFCLRRVVVPLSSLRRFYLSDTWNNPAETKERERTQGAGSFSGFVFLDEKHERARPFVTGITKNTRFQISLSLSGGRARVYKTRRTSRLSTAGPASLFSSRTCSSAHSICWFLFQQAAWETDETFQSLN